MTEEDSSWFKVNAEADYRVWGPRDKKAYNPIEEAKKAIFPIFGNLHYLGNMFQGRYHGKAVSGIITDKQIKEGEGEVKVEVSRPFPQKKKRIAIALTERINSALRKQIIFDREP